MVRKIIQLTEPQCEALEHRAKEQGVSVSELVRQGFGFVSSGDTDVSVRHDDYLAEAYGQ